MLLSWSCKICMVWIGQLINICTQHSFLSLFNPLPAPFFSPPSPFSPLLQHFPVLSHFFIVIHTHSHSTVIHTHSWTVCGNGRSVLRPCWGAADWSCTDLPPGPWGFVSHVCGAGLNTFSHSIPVFVSLSHSFSLQQEWHRLLLCTAVALTLLHPSPSISLSILPITGFLLLSVLIFFQFYFPWLILSFHLFSSLSLLIPSLKSFCSPCGFTFLLHCIDKFSSVSFTRLLLTLLSFRNISTE